MPKVEQDLLILSEHLSSPLVFRGVRFAQSLVLCVSLLFVLFLLNRIGISCNSYRARLKSDRSWVRAPIQSKDHTICICCFSGKHAAVRTTNWLVRNQNNVHECSDISTCGPLFQWASTIKSNSAYWSSTKLTASSSHQNVTCSRHVLTETLLNNLALGNDHSLTLLFFTFGDCIICIPLINGF